MSRDITTNPGCRVCKSESLVKFLSLGEMPPANNLAEPGLAENSYPLDVYFCKECGLAQLKDVVNPDLLFREYLYLTSTQSTLPRHFSEFAAASVKRFGLDKNSLIVEVGSNDGTLLRAFREHAMRVLGVDPALNLAQVAIETGIETICEYFTRENAKKIREIYGAASMIVANNVFAHINDVHDAVEAFKELLAEGGIVSIEVPYVMDMLEKIAYDTIYHEHLSYFSIKPLKILFESHGMQIFDIERIGTHGGSIRVYISRKGEMRLDKNVTKLLEEEEVGGVNTMERYEKFTLEVKKAREKFSSLLTEIKSSGKRIAGYSAPAKCSTMLNCCKIGKDTIDFIADKNVYKQGRLVPGVGVPIVSPEMIGKEKPDYVVIFAWNIADEIMKELDDYRRQGGKFIIPSSTPKVISANEK